MKKNGGTAPLILNLFAPAALHPVKNLPLTIEQFAGCAPRHGVGVL
jgi:hypothetical protein